MPDLTITNVTFNVAVTDADKLRESWKKAKARYEPETRARGIDFSKGLGPAIDKWAKSYMAFKKTADKVAAGTKLWTKIQPLTQAALKTSARAMKTDAKQVVTLTTKYLDKIEVLGDHDNENSDSSAAKRDLT